MVIFIVLLILLCFWVGHKDILSNFDSSGKKSNTRLDPYADILDINIEQVQYARNDAKFKTTVTFSDTYYYETHLTHRENGFYSYTISIDQELREQILRNAIFAHNAAVYENTGFRVPHDFIPVYRPTNAPALSRTAVFSADVWICRSCGTQNLNKVKTCQSCGVSKKWSMEQM